MRHATKAWKAAIITLSIVTIAWVTYLGVEWHSCDGRLHGEVLVECG